MPNNSNVLKHRTPIEFKVKVGPNYLATLPHFNKAIDFLRIHLHNEPSHNMFHALEVARIAVERAVKERKSKEVQMQAALAGLFHDAVRSSQEVSDKAGEKESTRRLIEFCKQQRISPSQRAPIVSALNKNKRGKTTLANRSKDISAYLEYADFVHFLSGSRIFSFVIENQEIRNLSIEKIEALYRKKFSEKLAALPQRTKRWLAKLAFVGTQGKSSNPLDLTTPAFENAKRIESTCARTQPKSFTHRNALFSNLSIGLSLKEAQAIARNQLAREITKTKATKRPLRNKSRQRR
jgi:hypothetical protein